MNQSGPREGILSSFAANPGGEAAPFRYAFRAMAAENELQLWAPDRARAERAARVAITDVLRIEAKSFLIKQAVRYVMMDQSGALNVNAPFGNA